MLKILHFILFFSIFVFPNSGRGEETTRLPFSFIAIGDVPYTGETYQYQGHDILEKMSQGISTSDARFVIHVGDYMTGDVTCSRKDDQIAIDFFRSLKKPVIFTPGDNDWADCDDTKARLKTVRKFFFESPDFKTIDNIKNQSTVSRKYLKFIENSTWSINGVRFVTIHVVGGTNNRPYSGYVWDHEHTWFSRISRVLFENTVFADTIFKNLFSAENIEHGDIEEFTLRERANIDWLQYALSKARKNDESALVIMSHGLVPGGGTRAGFEKIIEEVRTVAREFKKPILWIQGDEHLFKIDKPFSQETTNDVPYGEEINLVTRVIVPGPPMSWFVTIDVDLNTDEIFDISVKFPPAIESSVNPK